MAFERSLGGPTGARIAKTWAALWLKHSNELSYSLAQGLTYGAAAALDSTINRPTNQFGNPVADPSLGNAAKAGGAYALNKQAEAFTARMGSSPGYTEIAENQTIEIYILEDPREREPESD